MACIPVSSGKTLACLENRGGIKRAFITNFTDVASVTLDGSNKVDEIVMVSASPVKVFYEYNFKKQTGTLTSTLNKDVTKGTLGWATELKLTFFQNDQENFDQLKALVSNELAIVVEDNNSKLWYIGREFGAESTASAAEFGTALNDMNGYTITFTANEYLPSELVDVTVIEAVS